MNSKPHGLDFTYDEHGNVIYGSEFCGAPILPSKRYGLTVKDFINKYFDINTEIRLKFFKEHPNNLSEDIKTLINILKKYENNKNELIIKLNKFVNDYYPNTETVFNIQIKYFMEYLNELYKY